MLCCHLVAVLYLQLTCLECWVSMKIVWHCAAHDERASQLMQGINASLQIGASADGLQTMQVAAQLSSRHTMQAAVSHVVGACSQNGSQPNRAKQLGARHSSDMVISDVQALEALHSLAGAEQLLWTCRPLWSGSKCCRKTAQAAAISAWRMYRLGSPHMVEALAIS